MVSTGAAAGRLMAEPINLDQQATTPLAPEALAAMIPFLERQHWNPHSTHRGGRMAKAAVEAARVQVAAVLGAAAENIIFTSGATESNNLALKGYVGARGRARRRIISFATEHSCVLESVRHLERQHVPVTILPVMHDGMPDMGALRGALGPDVALVSAMRVNNEIGAIWPTAEIARLARNAGAVFHCDAAQGYGKIDCRLDGGLDGADLISISAHKIHGPKGIGALFIRSGLTLDPQMDGGGQEAGIRSGTLSPALAAGFGVAAHLAKERMEADFLHANRLMEVALKALRGTEYRVNGPEPFSPQRIPTNLSLTFPGIEAGRLVSALPGVAFSTGSACSSGSGKPSHVLRAIGLPADEARATIRAGWSRTLDEENVAEGFTAIAHMVRRMRQAAA